MNEANGYHFHEGDEENEFFLSEELDHEILMHRDAHFGGDFDVMLNYYSQDKVGVNPDFDLTRIEYLAEIEKQNEQNLAPLILSPSEIERVAAARKAYRSFKAIYDVEEEKVSHPRLIGDLILTEEEEPNDEIQAIVNEGLKISPELIAILKSEDAYDTLFPGYGFAPYLAMVCLALIKDPESIIPIFETIGRPSVFGDEPAFEALANFGEEGKKFLLKRLKSRPLNKDNFNAAVALSYFPPDIEIAKASFEELKDSKVRANPHLAAYLCCHADLLKGTESQKEFMTLAQDPHLPQELKEEMRKVVKDW